MIIWIFGDLSLYLFQIRSKKKRNNLCFFLGVFSMNIQPVGISNFLKSSIKSRAFGPMSKENKPRNDRSWLEENRAESPNFLRTAENLLPLIFLNKKNTASPWDLSWGIVVICEEFFTITPGSQAGTKMHQHHLGDLLEDSTKNTHKNSGNTIEMFRRFLLTFCETLIDSWICFCLRFHRKNFLKYEASLVAPVVVLFFG